MNTDPPPPGPELDRAVAEALGWHAAPAATHDGKPTWWYLAKPGQTCRWNEARHPTAERVWERCPAFSSDKSWEGLRLLVGRLRELGWAFSADSETGAHRVAFIRLSSPRIIARRDGESLPHAASLAALAALRAVRALEGGGHE